MPVSRIDASGAQHTNPQSCDLEPGRRRVPTIVRPVRVPMDLDPSEGDARAAVREFGEGAQELIAWYRANSFAYQASEFSARMLNDATVVLRDKGLSDRKIAELLGVPRSSLLRMNVTETTEDESEEDSRHDDASNEFEGLGASSYKAYNINLYEILFARRTVDYELRVRRGGTVEGNDFFMMFASYATMNFPTKAALFLYPTQQVNGYPEMDVTGYVDDPTTRRIHAANYGEAAPGLLMASCARKLESGSERTELMQRLTHVVRAWITYQKAISGILDYTINAADAEGWYIAVTNMLDVLSETNEAVGLNTDEREVLERLQNDQRTLMQMFPHVQEL